MRQLQELYWSETDQDGRGFVSLADAYRRAGNLAEAMRLLREGLGRHPGCASGHVVAGWTLLAEGEAARGADSFRAALELDPRNVAALRGLGELLKEEGELEEALGLFERLRAEETWDPLLDEHIRELRGLVEATAAAAGAPPMEEAAEEPPPGPWEDGAEVAEELDWDAATLQEDRSRPLSSAPATPAPSYAAPAALPPAEAEEEPAPGDFPEEPAGFPEEPAGFPEEPAGFPEEPAGFAEEPAAFPEEPAGFAQAPCDFAEEEEAPPSEREDVLVTRTLGEIYLRQGLLHRAEGVYEELLRGEPGNPELERRLGEIRSLLRGEALAPGEILPMEALAPDRVVPMEALAPGEILPMEALAPGEILPMEALAPDRVVPIEALAPDQVIPIEALAPDRVVPIEALAPNPPADLTLDAFQAWLDNLK